MKDSQKELVISGILSSLLFFAISAAIGGRKLIKEVFILPQNEKLILFSFFLGFLTAYSLFLMYETKGKLKKLFPEEIIQIVRESNLTTWLFVMTIASLSEEILFRGALQPVIGIIFTNLIFGFLHYLAEKRFIFMGVVAFIFGIINSLIYKWTNVLAYPIIVHLSHNLFSTIFMRIKKN